MKCFLCHLKGVSPNKIKRESAYMIKDFEVIRKNNLICKEGNEPKTPASICFDCLKYKNDIDV